MSENLGILRYVPSQAQFSNSIDLSSLVCIFNVHFLFVLYFSMYAGQLLYLVVLKCTAEVALTSYFQVKVEPVGRKK